MMGIFWAGAMQVEGQAGNNFSQRFSSQTKERSKQSRTQTADSKKQITQLGRVGDHNRDPRACTCEHRQHANRKPGGEYVAQYVYVDRRRRLLIRFQRNNFSLSKQPCPQRRCDVVLTVGDPNKKLIASTADLCIITSVILLQPGKKHSIRLYSAPCANAKIDSSSVVRRMSPQKSNLNKGGFVGVFDRKRY